MKTEYEELLEKYPGWETRKDAFRLCFYHTGIENPILALFCELSEDTGGALSSGYALDHETQSRYDYHQRSIKASTLHEAVEDENQGVKRLLEMFNQLGGSDKITSYRLQIASNGKTGQVLVEGPNILQPKTVQAIFKIINKEFEQFLSEGQFSQKEYEVANKDQQNGAINDLTFTMSA